MDRDDRSASARVILGSPTKDTLLMTLLLALLPERRARLLRPLLAFGLGRASHERDLLELERKMPVLLAKYAAHYRPLHHGIGPIRRILVVVEGTDATAEVDVTEHAHAARLIENGLSHEEATALAREASNRITTPRFLTPEPKIQLEGPPGFSFAPPAGSSVSSDGEPLFVEPPPPVVHHPPPAPVAQPQPAAAKQCAPTAAATPTPPAACAPLPTTPSMPPPAASSAPQAPMADLLSSALRGLIHKSIK